MLRLLEFADKLVEETGLFVGSNRFGIFAFTLLIWLSFGTRKIFDNRLATALVTTSNPIRWLFCI